MTFRDFLGRDYRFDGQAVNGKPASTDISAQTIGWQDPDYERGMTLVVAPSRERAFLYGMPEVKPMLIVDSSAENENLAWQDRLPGLWKQRNPSGKRFLLEFRPDFSADFHFGQHRQLEPNGRMRGRWMIRGNEAHVAFHKALYVIALPENSNANDLFGTGNFPNNAEPWTFTLTWQSGDYRYYSNNHR